MLKLRLCYSFTSPELFFRDAVICDKTLIIKAGMYSVHCLQQSGVLVLVGSRSDRQCSTAVDQSQKRLADQISPLRHVIAGSRWYF